MAVGTNSQPITPPRRWCGLKLTYKVRFNANRGGKKRDVTLQAVRTGCTSCTYTCLQPSPLPYRVRTSLVHKLLGYSLAKSKAVDVSVSFRSVYPAILQAPAHPALGGKGTLKRARQLRQFLEERLEASDEDDVFEVATRAAAKKRASGSVR